MLDDIIEQMPKIRHWSEVCDPYPPPKAAALGAGYAAGVRDECRLLAESGYRKVPSVEEIATRVDGIEREYEYEAKSGKASLPWCLYCAQALHDWLMEGGPK